MVSIESAVEKLADLAEPINRAERVPLQQALGRVLAHPLIAPIDVPSFDNSAMDGYALAGSDSFPKGSKFKLVGESRAGHPYQSALSTGQACRILTGAAIPDGTTTVLIQENASVSENHVVVEQSLKAGENIRPAGSDILTGQILGSTLEPINAYDLGLFASCGISEVEVLNKIKIAILSTGDELKNSNEDLGPGEIYESNRFTLNGLLLSKPVDVVMLDLVPDKKEMIKQMLETVADEVDLIVTSGGVSVGDTDFVRPVISEIGTLEFWRVALKPGKPLAVGQLGSALFFGLPGNPVSAVITYLLFVAPTIDLMCGLPRRDPMTFPATLIKSIEHRAGRREYQRGSLSNKNGDLVVVPTGEQSSNRLSSFHGCNCLIVVPENRDTLESGERVEVLLLPFRPTCFS